MSEKKTFSPLAYIYAIPVYMLQMFVYWLSTDEQIEEPYEDEQEEALYKDMVKRSTQLFKDHDNNVH